MPNSCWCYTTDQGYLLPTLLSAIQVKASLPDNYEQVVIICIGIRTDLVTAAERACSAEGIIFILHSKSAIDHFPMICARLFMDRLLTTGYDFITYLDGDTQIAGDVRRLSDTEPRKGSLLAAPDVMGLMAGDTRPLWRNCDKYFDRIGILQSQHRRYFNSGVIKVAMNDWKAISKECLLLLSKPKSVDYAFRDQDALNIILNGQHELMSIRWNWPGFFFEKGIDLIVPPKIVHYMSRPRPWDGAFPPWGNSANVPYKELIKSYPDLECLYRPAKGLKYLRYHAQQRWKGLFEDYDSLPTHDRIKESEIDVRI